MPPHDPDDPTSMCDVSVTLYLKQNLPPYPPPTHKTLSSTSPPHDSFGRIGVSQFGRTILGTIPDRTSYDGTAYTVSVTKLFVIVRWAN